jgi:hypothetical protein
MGFSVTAGFKSPESEGFGAAKIDLPNAGFEASVKG